MRARPSANPQPANELGERASFGVRQTKPLGDPIGTDDLTLAGIAHNQGTSRNSNPTDASRADRRQRSLMAQPVKRAAGGVVVKASFVSPSESAWLKDQSFDEVSPRSVPRESGTRRLYPIAKRIGDVAIALPALVAFLPVIGAFWVAVRMTSRGPGLHWSKRVGRNGAVFQMPKLRTMEQDAPVMAREAFTPATDKTTPLGRVLRAHSLDELPQFWSILRGDMSLIGPRPLLPNDPASEERRQRPVCLSVRPGMTGLAQIRGRNHVQPRRKARYDAFYASRQSAGFDAWIVWQTLSALFFRRGGGVL